MEVTTVNDPTGRTVRVCGTCHGTGTITRPRAIIGRPGLGPRRIVRLDASRPLIFPCPACHGTRPAAPLIRR
jgi:hypothetical protein